MYVNLCSQKVQQSVASLQREVAELRNQSEHISATTTTSQLPHQPSTPHLISIKCLLTQKDLGVSGDVLMFYWRFFPYLPVFRMVLFIVVAYGVLKKVFQNI